jgi:ribosomal protein L11 methyltransferase
MNWKQLELLVHKDKVDVWSDALTNAGAVAITMEPANSQRVYELDPSHKPMWDDVKLLILFAEDVIPQQIQQQLEPQIDFVTANWKTIIEDDWVNKWQEYAKPMQFGDKLWICPSWCEIPDPSANNIILDPEMAFGTGSHATTGLCLDWIAHHIEPGITVIDYGCGSGILGIAAARLGAVRVYGVDIDPVALEVSEKNAAQNNVSAALFTTHLPEDLPNIQADIVIANILALPLLSLAATLTELVKPGGSIILSGILQEQSDMVIAGYSTAFDDFKVTSQEGWVRIIAKNKSIN